MKNCSCSGIGVLPIYSHPEKHDVGRKIIDGMRSETVKGFRRMIRRFAWISFLSLVVKAYVTTRLLFVFAGLPAVLLHARESSATGFDRSPRGRYRHVDAPGQ